MNEQATCPECGKPLPTGSAHGICPACLMAQAMASRTLNTEGKDQAAVPPPTPEEIADKFPQFEMVECLGRGGMGVVYKARQKSLDRWVAIKVLAPERVHEERFAEHFEREAKTLAKMSHPNIVTVFDHGQTDGLFYIVMEFVDGLNLRDLLREAKMEPEQALAIIPPICDALEYAHDKGVVHRDIKPENILLDRDGRVKIADFGIASLVGVSGEKSGTPPYMAPEQENGIVDRRADIYALGAVLYEMLTGERPNKELVAPSKKVHIDVRLDEIVLRALEKTPELRYQTADEFRTVVETVAATPATGRRRSDEAQTENRNRPKASSQRTLLLFCLMLAYFLTSIRPFIWAYGILSKSAGPSVSIVQVQSQIREIDRSVEELMSRASLSAAQIMEMPPDRVDEFQRDKSILKQAEIAATPKDDLLEQIRREEMRQNYKKQRPMAYGFIALGIGMLAIGVLLLRWVLKKLRGSRLTAAAGIDAKGSSRPTSLTAATPDTSLDAFSVGPCVSRAAIVGACWAPFAFLATFAWLAISQPVPASSDPNSPGPVFGWMQLLSFILLLLGITAPFGTTLLGWAAVSQIRRSAGKLHGMWLAVFDGLLFPLLALDALLIGLPFTAIRLVSMPHTPMGIKLSFLLIPAGLVILTLLITSNVFIIRRVWRAVNKTPEDQTSVLQKSAAGNYDRALKVVFLCVLVVSLLGGAVSLIIGLMTSRAHQNAALARADFHCRVFEADAALVDRLIPAAQRKPGVQPGAKFIGGERIYETSISTGTGMDEFTVTKHGQADTDSQMAGIDFDTLSDLLQGIGTKPGILANETREVSGIWWPKGMAAHWTYSTQKDGLAIHGNGLVQLAYTVDGPRDQIRIEGQMQHNPDFKEDPDDFHAKFLYEGDAPLTRALAFLVPFVKKDRTPHYLVVVYEVSPGGDSGSQQASYNLPLLPVNEAKEPIFATMTELDLKFTEGQDTANLLNLDTGLIEQRSYQWEGAEVADKGPDATPLLHIGENDQALWFRVRSIVFFKKVANTWWTSDPLVTVKEIERLFPARVGYSNPWINDIATDKTELPQTFLFRTPKGTFGILQVTGSTENPRGVKIRYKPVRYVSAFEIGLEKPGTIKPIPAEAVRLMEEIRQVHDSPEFRSLSSDKPDEIKHYNEEINRRLKMLQELLRGTRAESLFDESMLLNQRIREQARENHMVDPELRERADALSKQLQEMLKSAAPTPGEEQARKTVDVVYVVPDGYRGPVYVDYRPEVLSEVAHRQKNTLIVTAVDEKGEGVQVGAIEPVSGWTYLESVRQRNGTRIKTLDDRPADDEVAWRQLAGYGPSSLINRPVAFGAYYIGTKAEADKFRAELQRRINLYTDAEAEAFRAKLDTLKYPITTQAACEALGIDLKRLKGEARLMKSSIDGRVGQSYVQLSGNYWISFQFQLYGQGSDGKAVLNDKGDHDKVSIYTRVNLREVRKKDDKVEVSIHDDTLFVDAVSPSGIGDARLTLTSDNWPKKLVVRLRYSADKPFTNLEGPGATLEEKEEQDENLKVELFPQKDGYEASIPPTKRKTLYLHWVDAYRN